MIGYTNRPLSWKPATGILRRIAWLPLALFASVIVPILGAISTIVISIVCTLLWVIYGDT